MTTRATTLTVYPCPVCGASTTWNADCPGYDGRGEHRGAIMVCNPPCGNAIRFTCDKCGWWHRSPNKRDASKMGIAPAWLNDALAEMEPED